MPAYNRRCVCYLRGCCMTSLGYKEVTRSTARAHLDGDRKYAQSLQASGASLEKALAHSTTLTVDQLEEVLPPAPRLPEEDDDFGEGDDAPAQKRSRTEDWEMTVDKGDGRDDDDSAVESDDDSGTDLEEGERNLQENGDKPISELVLDIVEDEDPLLASGGDSALEEEEEEEQEQDPPRDGDDAPNPAAPASSQSAAEDEAEIPQLQPIPRTHRPSPTPPSRPPEVRNLSELEVLSLVRYAKGLIHNETQASFNSLDDFLTLWNPSRPRPLTRYLCQQLLEEVSELKPVLIDACPQGCQAYTGSLANDTSCGHLRSKVDPSRVAQPGKAPPKHTVACGTPRHRLVKGRSIPQNQALLLPILPRVKALLNNPQLAEKLLYFGRTLRASHSARASSGDKLSGTFNDVPQGLWAENYFPFFVDEERTWVIAISTDGADLDANDNLWIWIVELYNLSPQDGRYRREFMFDVMLSHGPHSPSNLESFALPIFEMLQDAFEGFWVWDESRKEWFLWRMALVSCLADLMGAVKASGLASIRGRLPCPDCCMIGCRNSKGHGSYLVMGRRDLYVKEVARGKELNIERPEEGYDPRNLPLRNLDSYRNSLNIVFNPPNPHSATKLRNLKAEHSLVFAPLVARTPLFQPSTMFPPDASHQLLLNVPNLFYTHDAVWHSLPDIKTLLEDAAELADKFRLYFPSSFGTFPRNTFHKHNSNYKMHEWSTFVFHISIPTLDAVGFPRSALEQWGKYVELCRLVVDRSDCGNERVERIRSLAVEVVEMHERLWVQGDLDRAAAMPVVVHRLLHLADAILLLGNLTCLWQLPLERHIATIKHFNTNSLTYASIANRVTFLAQLDILRWKYPEIARHLAKDLGEKEGEERRVGAKTGLTGAEKREATQETVKVLRLMGVEDAEELASTATKSGTAFLINGDHLRATLNHATRTSTSAHHNSAFLTTTRDSLGRATPSTFTVGNAIALLTFPSRNPSPLLPLGLSQVAVLAELYPEPTVEWGMRWSDGAKEREKVLLPLEEVEELVFCMEVEKVGVTKVWFSLKPTRDSLS